MTATITATPVAASAYLLGSTRVERGDIITVQYAHHKETLAVEGDPITVGRQLMCVRVREVGGRHDGNTFSAYLYLR